VSATPWVAGPLYGLRSWTVVSDHGRELLAGPYTGTLWPPGGEWLRADCGRSATHLAPRQGCDCGIHAWHPRRASARRVLAGRNQLAGLVETSGVVEVHEEGFRAERARPSVLFVSPRRNPHAAARLGATYGADVVDVDGPDALLAWCRERQLGLSEPVVTALIGPAAIEERHRTRRRKRRADALRVAAALVAAVLLGLFGDMVLSGPPPERSSRGAEGQERQGTPPGRLMDPSSGHVPATRSG
jgi:hypothetical protein